MRVLHLTHKPPYPSVDGGCKAMARLIDCLMECGCEVDHFTLYTDKHPFDLKAYPQKLAKKMRIYSEYVRTNISAIDAFRSLFTNHSYNINRFDTPGIHEQLRKLVTNNCYDAVIFDSLYVVTYLETIEKSCSSKLILRAHNVEHSLWEQWANSCSPGLKKWYLKKLARDLKRFELSKANKMDIILCLSNSDKKRFEQLGIHSNLTILPIAITQNLRNVNDNLRKLFFVGSMNWTPNIEAAKHLVEILFPEIRKKFPDVELHLAGSYMGSHFPENKEMGIFNHGFAEDLEGFMSNHGIMVLPIQSGSGIRIKILEAMALGIPIITSEKGAQGINAPQALIVTSNDNEMLKSIENLLLSEEKRKEFGERSWDYVHQNLSITKVAEQLHEVLQN